MRFFWSEFASVKDDAPHDRESTWQEFVDSCLIFQTVTDKKSVGLWSPTAYLPNRKRGKSGIRALSALVVDYDYKDDTFLQRLQTSLSPYEYVIHTTFQHLAQPYLDKNGNMVVPGHRYRVILPFERPASRAQWFATKAHFLKLTELEGEQDQQANHEATLFYWPAHPPDCVFFYHRNEGRFLEVIDSDSITIERSKTAVGEGVITGVPGEHAGFMRRWALSAKDSDAFKWYSHFADGKSFGDVGKRDESIQRAMWVVANRMDREQIRLTDEQVIFDFVEASVEATPAGPDGDKITLDVVAEKLRRARRDVLFDREGEVASLEESNKFLDALFSNTSDEPVRILPTLPAFTGREMSDEEKNIISQRFFNGGPIHWCIGKNGRYSVLTNVGFSRWLWETEVGQFAREEKLPVNPYTLKNNKWELMNGKEFSQSYGVYPRDFVGAFMGESNYDEATRIFTEVANPIRKANPVFDKEIDDYLKVFCAKSTDYARLCMWLSAFPNLNKPNSILFVYGPPNTGKTLLGSGLARFWGLSYGIQPDEYFGQFQDRAVRCPFIMADEGLPREMTRSQDIRSFVTRSEHRINRKGIASYPVFGHMRMMVSANDIGDIKFKDEDLTKDKIRATNIRFLYIETSSAATEYIEQLGGLEWTTSLVEGNRLMQHVSWLAENFRPVNKMSVDSRFSVTSEDTEGIQDDTIIEQRLSRETLSVIIACLRDRQNQDVAKAWSRKLITWFEGKLWVTAQIVSESQIWQNVNYGMRVDLPVPARFGSILKTLSSSGRQWEKRFGQYKWKYWDINLRLLRRYAEMSGLASEEIDEFLTPIPEGQEPRVLQS